MHARHLIVAFASALAGLVACDDGEIPPLGSMDVTTSAPTLELGKETVTADGWTVKFDRFLVHVSAVTVAGDDGVVAASAPPQILDQVAPSPKSLLSATLRTARPWEKLSIQLGPASAEAEATFAEPVTAADRDMMQTRGLTFYVEGRLAKAGAGKLFKWGVSTDTLHKDCAGERDGAVIRGLVVPPDGGDSADIAMSGSVLFSDDLAAPGAHLTAESIVRADSDGDDVVTFEELHAMPLEEARTDASKYQTGEASDVTDMGTFVEHLSRRVVTHFRGSGTCTAEPVIAEP
jgi:hypothetical protein